MTVEKHTHTRNWMITSAVVKTKSMSFSHSKGVSEFQLDRGFVFNFRPLHLNGDKRPLTIVWLAVLFLNV